MDDLFEPVPGPVLVHRASTPGSRFAERLILTFLSCNADVARVHVERTPYSLDELYDLCRRVCRKKDFIKKVSVSKNDGDLLLKKENRGSIHAGTN